MHFSHFSFVFQLRRGIEVLVSSMFLALGGDQGVTTQDILAGLADADAAIVSLSVTVKCESLERSHSARDQILPLRSVSNCVAERSGRARYEGFSDVIQEGEKPTTVPLRAMAVFDGTTARVIEGTMDRFYRGRIGRNRADIPWKMDPWEFATHFLGKTVSDILATHGAVIMGTATTDGRSVTVVETPPIVKEESWKARFWIDTARNFTIVRKSALIQFTPAEAWIEYAFTECSEYAEINPGIWLPSLALHKTYDPRKGGQCEILRDSTNHLEDWNVNSPNPDTMFQLAIPPGVYVTDEVTGQKYENARITDQMVADSASQAARLQELLSKMPTQEEILRRSKSHVRVYVYTAVAVGTLLLAVWAIWMFGRRANRELFGKPVSLGKAIQ